LIVSAALTSALIYVIAMHLIAGGAGFPLDDAWIHQTYARNLAQSGQFQYAPGVESAGSTSPLYTLLLTVGYILHIPYFAWTYLLGAAALALAAFLGARLADRLFPGQKRVGLWTAMAIGVSWHLVWAAASGMETILFSAWSLVVIALAWRESDAKLDTDGVRSGQGATFGLAGAILIAIRPEGVVLVGLLGLLVIVAQWKNRLPLVSWLLGAAVAGFVGLIPYALLNLHLNGTILPNTFSAKQAEHAPLLAQPFLVNLWAMLQPLTAGGELLLIPGALVACNQLAKREPRASAALLLVTLLWPICLILLYTLRLPAYYEHGRYVIPALLPFLAIGVGGTVELVAAMRRSRQLLPRLVGPSLAIATLLVFLIFWLNGALVFASDVRSINSDMVVAAQWLAANVPSDTLLAAHDIGAVGYFAPRPLLDLAGLVSPEVIPIILDDNAKMALMQQRGVRYLMVLPPQRPVPADDPRLCERFNAHGAMGGMTVYKLAWDGHCS